MKGENVPEFKTNPKKTQSSFLLIQKWSINTVENVG